MMQYIAKVRDGHAKIGQFTLDKKDIITPNILFLDTNRFNAPDFADIILSNKDKITKKPIIKYKKITIDEDKDFFEFENKDLAVVQFASQLFKHPTKFVSTIVNIKEKIGYNKAILIPAICRPSNLSLLTYMGIDFFDSIYSIIAARNKTMLFSDGAYPLNDLKEIPCNCEICSKIKNSDEMSFDHILYHNYYALFNELKLVRNMIKKGDLRSLVEKRVKSDPTLTALLRNLDNNFYDFYENKTSVSGKNIIYANSKESMCRPDILRFQQRVIERYKKPKSAKILLMLPCSAKKPYSFSASHKHFIEKIQSASNPNVIHELIITSPLGIVPRELELTYPASHYDIPVTNVWDEDEKKMIRYQLSLYLKANKYDKIIMHLPVELTKFTKDLVDNPIFTCIDKPLSKKSLDKLSLVVNKQTNEYDKITNQTRFIENMKSLSYYQFGKNSAEILMKNSVIRGKYPYQKIISENKQIGMLIKERGLISLTLDGASRLVKSKDYWVEISDDFELVGSVFAPGVKKADEKIRRGDEVVVIKNKNLAGVGVAQMSGHEMINSVYGEAVKLRHRV